jgi:hypothetical protein
MNRWIILKWMARIKIDQGSPGLTIRSSEMEMTGVVAADLGRRGPFGGPGGREGGVRGEGRLHEAMCKVDDAHGDLLRRLWTDGGVSRRRRLQSTLIFRDAAREGEDSV